MRVQLFDAESTLAIVVVKAATLLLVVVETLTLKTSSSAGLLEEDLAQNTMESPLTTSSRGVINQSSLPWEFKYTLAE